MPGLFGIDFGAIFDNLRYGAMFTVGGLLWLLHVIMLTIADIINFVTTIVSSVILKTVLDVVIGWVGTTGLVTAFVYLAIILFAMGLLASFITDLRLVDFRKVLLYGVLASLVLTHGAEGMTKIEHQREMWARAIYDQVVNSLLGSSALAAKVGSLPSGGPTANFQINDYYSGSNPGIRAWDIALSAVMVAPPGGEETDLVLPMLFQQNFFRYTNGIEELQPASARSVALQEANDGLARLVIAYPLSFVAILEAIMEMLFSIAAAFLLVAIPLALVFSFFLPTEAIAFSLVRQYLILILNYLVISVMTAFGMAVMLLAAARNSLPVAVSGSIFASVFFYMGIKTAWQMVQGSFTAVTGSIAQVIGVREPISEALGTAAGAAKQAAVVAAGAAVGATGAGLALAAGQALGSDQANDNRAGLLRTGIAAAGGMMMQGTPLAGPAMALASLRAANRDGSLVEALTEMPAEDAMLIGMSARSNNPLGMVLTMDRRARALQGWADNRARRGQMQQQSSDDEISARLRGWQPGAPPQDDSQARQQRPTAGADIASVDADEQGEWRRRPWRSIPGLPPHFKDRLAEIERERGAEEANYAAGQYMWFEQQSLRTRMHPTGQVIPNQPAPTADNLPVFLPMFYRPEYESPWRQEVDAAIERYGQNWADQIARAIAQAISSMRGAGLTDQQIIRKFTDEQGRPAFTSRNEGSRAIFDAMPVEMRETLKDKGAQMAVTGIIGEIVMPRIEIPRAALVQAIAEVVAEGAQQGAVSVAQKLAVPAAALGSYYGPINAIVAHSQEMGLSSNQVQQILSGKVPGELQHDPNIAQLAARGNMLKPIPVIAREIGKTQMVGATR